MRIIALFIVLISHPLLADTVFLKNGNSIDGNVTDATASIITIETNGHEHKIDKTELDSIRFTNADIIVYKYKDPFEGIRYVPSISISDVPITICKVISRIDNNIIIVTSQGIFQVDQDKIKEIKYNLGKEITVPNIPETGVEYNNEPNPKLVFDQDGLRKNIYLNGIIGLGDASLTKWADKLVLEDEKDKARIGIAFFFAGEIGWVISKYYQCGIGYEYQRTVPVDAKITIPGQYLYSASQTIKYKSYVAGSFIYGSIKAGYPVWGKYLLYWYLGMDVGSMTATEYTDIPYGNNSNISGSTFAYPM